MPKATVGMMLRLIKQACFAVTVCILVEQGTAYGIEDCSTTDIRCDSPDIYGEVDGSCNNRQHPEWGAADTPLSRLLPAEYEDREQAPRTYGTVRRLPSPRAVSNSLKEVDRETSKSVSHLHVLWGQYITHDFAHTPMTKQANGSDLDCKCFTKNSECINIELPLSDQQFLEIGKTCMPLARSKQAVGLFGCEFQRREQLNTLSSVMDGSALYGRSLEDTLALKDPNPNSGRLKTQRRSKYDLLPTQDQIDGSISNSTQCRKKVHKPVEIPCFVAGDFRNNENSGLASIVTVWVRYHNKIADELSRINPQWNGDRIFQVTRRIIIGLTQIIHYREYLPPLLGPTWTKRFRLQLAERQYWNGYDSRYNPSITNEFTTAAFRYGHSQVAESLSRPGPLFDNGKYPPVQSDDSFFNSEPLLNGTGGGAGSIMRGFIIDNAETTDGAFVEDLRNQLFTEFGEKFGGDLFAINIQRGRDHGLPGYNSYRVLCGLKRAYTFDDLSEEIPHDTIEKLRRVYNSVDDIDLYPGGIVENHVEGGQVGPTFACILAYGFRAIRRGDRFWHEHENSPAKFTLRQLQTLRKITFARVLCDVADEMIYVTKEPMLHNEDVGRSSVKCDQIPGLDLHQWRDLTTYHSGEYERSEEEFSRWFVTQQTSDDYDIEICDSPLDFDVRSVPSSPYVQIRFACPSGTIAATDFPHQLSSKYQWSEWLVAVSVGYGDGFEIHIDEFRCGEPIAIQAMAMDGKYARETGDVFDYYDVKYGFRCLHEHQMYNACNRYKIRVLCHGDYATPKPNAPPTGTHLYPDASIDDKSNEYCREYGVCCGYRIYKTFYIPLNARKEMQEMCTKYKTCCEISY